MTSILQSANGPTEVINARRTESLDAPHILKLVNSSTSTQFGLVNVVNIIEKAVLAVTLNNEKGKILAHAAFFDYPNIANVDQAKWEDWLRTSFNVKNASPLNSLFLHYFVAKKEFSHGSAREIIRTVFNAVPDIHYLFFLLPADTEPESALADTFLPLDGNADTKPVEKYALYVCYRHDHCPVLHVRKARVEDHDDLTPIFNRQSDMLKTNYGDFFLAEMIESQDEENHCLIVEMEGTAVGFLSITYDVDLDMLNSCFELMPFHGLHKPHDEDVLRPLTPQPEPTPVEVVKPPSQTSEVKVLSRSSSLMSGEAVTAEGAREPSTQPNQQPVNGETPAEAEVERKLSDVHMHSAASLASGEHVDEEEVGSVHSVASKRSGTGDSKQDVALEQADIFSKTPAPATPPLRFEPSYKGASNVFSIQLFCIDERFEMRSLDFLPMAFSLFPDKDFCALTVPHLVPEFPLLQNFVRVTPRCPSILPQELYVFNKAGLIQSFIVRPACASDTSAIEGIVGNINNREILLKDLAQYNQAKRDVDGTPIQAYVATCLDQVVGIAITRQEEDIEYIRSHYNVEDFIYYNHHRRDEHGHVHHFALNPVFVHWSKHFLKEVLRQAHYTCLYYPVYPEYAPQEVRQKQSLPTCLNFMVPVRARRQIIYPLEHLGGNAPSDRVLKQQEQYALCHINRKLTLEPKVTINARIVVVGASDVGLSFLKSLVFCPHLRFNNLVLISTHGLPGELPPDEMRTNFLSTHHCFSQDELAQISLRTWVNVVKAKMVGISRTSKYVKITGGKKVPFDHLILCTGMQYQISAPTGADATQMRTSADLPNNPDRRFLGKVPRNVFVINDEFDADSIIKWIQKNFIDSGGKAIVYGLTLDAYTTVQTLLTLGIPGDRIAMVQPPLNYQISCFNNPTVENAVKAAITSAGVELHQGYYLAQWNDSRDVEEVYCASFTSDTKPLKLECSAFFCFNRKAVDYEAFKAINDSCLVYDGSLVIDSNFHTNDLSIRGAGTLTKFQRKYHTEAWTHSNFNSKEVGVYLASIMLCLFDPTIENDASPPEEPMNLIPTYREAKIQGGVIPGGFHYLHFAKPALPTSLEAVMSQLDFGRELITGSAEGSDPNFFRLHINQYKSIETLTCLSKKPFEISNFLCLYNLHERFLNNMVARFDEGLIKDFYVFFRENWTLALFHDRFQDFRQEVRELLIQRPSESSASLEEKVRQLIDQDLQLEKNDRQYLTDEYVSGGAKRSVETRLLSFLSYNHYHLPMYAKPGMI